MDPTLLQQHSSPFDFPISSESKYIHDRPFSNPSFPTNDFPYSRGRSQSTLTSGASGPGVALPTNSSLEFNNNSLLNDTPVQWYALDPSFARHKGLGALDIGHLRSVFLHSGELVDHLPKAADQALVPVDCAGFHHRMTQQSHFKGVTYNPYHPNSQLLLSPPDSTTSSASVSGNPTSSSIVYTTLPKPFASNAYATDHFSSAPQSVLTSNWTGSSMTVMDRPSRPHPPPLSPPLSYPANGIGPTLLNTRPMGDRLHNPYQPNGPSISSGAFHPSVSRYPHNIYNRSASYGVPDISYANHPMATFSADNPSPARQDGPPFGETKVHYPVLTVRSQRLVPDIMASIQKGFFQVDRKWTCYRRNYFAVACSFAFKSPVADGPFYLNRNGQDELIHQFAVSISAKTASTGNGESEARGLVQHTPKRDKATESLPCRHPISPTPNQTMGGPGLYSSSGHMYGSQHMNPSMMGGYGAFENPGATSVPTTHTFERIQFQKATANNGKRRAQQQYFVVVVELSVNVARTPGDENWIVIATKESEPMVVRGRSPGHYKDNGRRDSQTSMDPDRGGGHGGESSLGQHASGGFPHSSMDWCPPHRSTGHYVGSSYHHAMNPSLSPASMASSSTLTGTPTDGEPTLSDSHTANSSCTLPSDRSALTPLSDDSEEMMFSLNRSNTSRKRPFEDDEDGDHLRFPLSGPFADNMSALADYSATPYSKLLCASS